MPEAAERSDHGNPGDQKSALRLAMAVREIGPTEAGRGAPAALPPAKAPPTEGALPSADAVDDPTAVLAELARRTGNERVSGRLAPSSYPFLEFGHPDIDYASHPGYGRSTELWDEVVGDVVRPLYDAFAPIWNNYLTVTEHLRPFAVPAAHGETFRTLERDGILVLKMSDAERAELIALTEPMAVEVHRRREKISPLRRGVEASSGSVYHAKNNRTDFVDFLERVFTDHGMLAMASAYQGLPLERPI